MKPSLMYICSTEYYIELSRRLFCLDKTWGTNDHMKPMFLFMSINILLLLTRSFDIHPSHSTCVICSQSPTQSLHPHHRIDMDMLKYEKVFASLGETELADSPGLGLKSPSEYPRVPENVQKPLQIESVHNEENAQQPFLAPIPYAACTCRVSIA